MPSNDVIEINYCISCDSLYLLYSQQYGIAKLIGLNGVVQLRGNFAPNNLRIDKLRGAILNFFLNYALNKGKPY
jgi:hypothetical protein